MNNGKLELANKLNFDIVKYNEEVRGIDFKIQQLTSSEFRTKSMSCSYKTREASNHSWQSVSLKIGIPNELIIKVLNDRRYIANNLLNKYKLEFSKL